MEAILEPSRKRWTEREQQMLETFFLSGFDDTTIGRMLGRSAASISMQRHRTHIVREPLIADRDAVVEMARAGATIRRIAARRQLSQTTVRFVLKEAKVEPREFSSYEGPNARRAGR